VIEHPLGSELFGFWNWADGAIRIVIVVLVMTVVAMYLIYGERKIVARFQQRLGPTRTGPAGLFQSFADAVKLVSKEDIRPANADRWVFEFAPYFTFIPIFITLCVLPFAEDWGVRNLTLGLFFVFAVMGLEIVGVLMAGLGSGNKFALLGGVRAAAQMISYEIPLVLSLLAVVMVAGTLDLNKFALQQGDYPYIILQPLAFMIFFTAMLSELHRAPFDIPVAESEIVGGYFVEYSGIRWSMFMLTEYAAMWSFSVFGSIVFLGGWNYPMGEEWGWWWQLILTAVKSALFIFLMFWVRATVPRLRVDQLMTFCWKVLLPLALAQILANGFILVYDGPNWMLSLTSGIGAAILVGIIVSRAFRRKKNTTLVGAYRTAQVPAQ
jgi:NADH-quinone oxidoreductase subunit H